MPLAPDQDMFEPAYCDRCGKRAELRFSHNNQYAYWCCGTRWVVEGSKMDVYNALIYVDDDLLGCANCDGDVDCSGCG